MSIIGKKTVQFISLTLIGLVVMMGFSASSLTASAESELSLDNPVLDEINTTLKRVKDKDPNKVISEKLTRNNKNSFTSEQKTLNIDFDLKGKKVKIMNKTKGETVISVPNIAGLDSVNIIDNKIIYSGKDAKADTIVEAVDGGIRQVINIKSADAPNYYDFPVMLEEGDKIIINDDGGAKIESSKVNEITQLPINKVTIAKPWAKDANGKDLKTNYTIENKNILRQYIDLSSAVFPVVADPLWCGNFFFQHTWEDRASEGGLTLKNYPTWCGRSFDTGYGFDEIIYNSPDNSAWPKSSRGYYGDKNRSMYNQYRCHVWFAWFFKSSYNFEPSRPLVDWQTMITRNLPYACNP